MKVRLLKHARIGLWRTKSLLISPVVLNNRTVAKADFNIEKKIGQPEEEKECQGKHYDQF